MRNPRTTTTTGAALLLATALALSACGGTEDADPPAPASPTAAQVEDHVDNDAQAEHDEAGHDEHAEAGAHSDADVTFAQMMIPHHEQAVQMSDILLAKEGVPPEIAALAERIKAAQAPEIEQMSGWLEEWGAPREADTEHGGQGGHEDNGGHEGHGGADGMAGMVDEAGIAALEAAPGPEAARLYLEQMIGHHEGAVDMSETEIADGAHPDAVALAREIVRTQQAEIEEMRGLL